MTRALSSESAEWILPSYPKTFTSTLPNFEESLPFRVNREGVQNYIKNRGSLNIGDWAVEGRRMSTTIDSTSVMPPPKVLGTEALRNYTRSRSTTPDLINGRLQPPESRGGMRVKREGQANYEKSHYSQTKDLMENYGKLPPPAPPVPHIQGQLATELFYTHQEGRMGSLLNNYGRNASTPRPIPHVKGVDATINREKGLGDSQLLDHGVRQRPTTSDPHVKGVQAQTNYDNGQGRYVTELFHQYGKLRKDIQTAPKVKFDGVQNLIKGQGDEMRKTISQCPPTGRYRENLQSVPPWS